MQTIDNNYGNTSTCSGGGGGEGGSVSKHATFIKYRLNQIIKSKCVSDKSEMKIMIQCVT